MLVEARGLIYSRYAAFRFAALARHLPVGDEAKAHAALRSDLHKNQDEDRRVGALEQLAIALPSGDAGHAVHAALRAEMLKLHDPIARDLAHEVLARTAPAA